MENYIQPTWVALSERVYTALLVLYPAEFRRDYARWMAQAFRDVTRDTYRREGGAGLALWWGSALFDLAISVIEQRRKEIFVMPKSILPAWAGRLLIVGGICLALTSYAQLEPGDHYVFTGLHQISILFVGPAFTLIALVCFGLPSRYREQFEPLTRLTMYVAGIGALTTIGGFMMSSFVNETFWMVAMIGLIVHIIAMVIFGLANITRPLLPMPRYLPIITGLLPLIMLVSSQSRTYSSPPDWVGFACLLGTGIAWLMMGVFISREKQVEVQPAAA